MVRLLEDALGSIPAEERSLRAQVLSRLAAALSPPTTDEAMASSIRYAREAIAIARELGDVPTLLHALFWSTTALFYVTPLEERVELTSELVSLAREHGADVILAQIGGFYTMSLLESGRPVAARHEAKAYCRLVESLPVPTLQWRATALRGTMAALDGRIDDARAHAEALRHAAATVPQAANGWMFFEIGLCVATRDTDRVRQVERELAEGREGHNILGSYLSLVDVMLGRKDVGRLRLRPLAELPRGLAGVLVSAQIAVLLESVELAQTLYEPLVRAAPFARLFGPAGVFPLGPVSRILGELALLRGDAARAREHFDAAIVECREMEAAPLLALAEEGRARVGGASAPTKAAAKKSPEVSFALSREGDVWLVRSSTSAPRSDRGDPRAEFPSPLSHPLRGREPRSRSGPLSASVRDPFVCRPPRLARVSPLRVDHDGGRQSGPGSCPSCLAISSLSMTIQTSTIRPPFTRKVKT
jgi:hypothetical protein